MSSAPKGNSKRKKTGSAVRSEVVPAPRPPVFPIVGVGASAGGLEAFVELLRALPDKPGMAFVLIQHQDRDHASFLAEILSKATKMPVAQVNEDVVVGPNRVYVAPPDAQLIFEEGQLRMTPRPTGHSMPIDRFFETLAADQGSRAIVVVLSGLASDGTEGAKAVKLGGGITFAQDVTAKFNGMPTSAVSSGAVDFVLSPSEIASELTRIAEHASTDAVSAHFPVPEMTSVFEILQQQGGVDFSNYKPTTIERRLRRRMAVHNTDSIAEYVALLERDPNEVAVLNRELLIHVTSFFRDPEVFEALTADVIPQLLASPRTEDPVRVWVPGCATGEEVYSFAMILLEQMEKLGRSCPIQIFGTDISEGAIEIARAGVYPEAIAAEVSAERLERFFTKTNGSYRVKKAVRECCIFARQNLTNDPPFSKLDLISCRNVLIYLGESLQRKVISVLHYALRPGGLLILGSAETIGNFADLFTPMNRKHRIYRKKEVATPPVEFDTASTNNSEAQALSLRNDGQLDATALTSPFREADRVVMARYAPPGVLINDRLEILQFRGRTSPFLEPPSGAASFNLLKMLREGLMAEVRQAIQSARRTSQLVRREGVRFRREGTTVIARIEVLPFIVAGGERHFVVSFEELSIEPAPKRTRGSKAAPGKSEPRNIVRLKAELEATREYLQSIIEEQEAMNEELRSANEEIQSSNEELQSVNEELETAKEELQSTNEELATVNEELENRNQEATTVNNDLTNLISSVDIPIILVDSKRHIRRFTPGAQRALNLLPSDIGRPISDLRSKLKFDGFDEMISQVVDTLETREKEVQSADGSWHSLRVRPYKTVDNHVDGAVIALFDLKKNA